VNAECDGAGDCAPYQSHSLNVPTAFFEQNKQELPMATKINQARIDFHRNLMASRTDKIGEAGMVGHFSINAGRARSRITRPGFTMDEAQLSPDHRSLPSGQQHIDASD
jgi:hypothetical protein